MATTAPSGTRSGTRLTSFRDAPRIERPERPRRRRSLPARIARGVLLGVVVVVAVFTFWAVSTPPAHALFGEISDMIRGICGPKNIQVENRGSGVNVFYGPAPNGDSGTYLYGNTKNELKPPTPTYQRYGMAGLFWQPWGNSPGCLSESRLLSGVANYIFNASKLFAVFTMALIGWSFGTPFSFLSGPINTLSHSMFKIASAFLGVVGVAGALYLAFKNWGPKGRLTALFKGIGWMGMITSLFLWYGANNATFVSNMIDQKVGFVANIGFDALPKGAQCQKIKTPTHAMDGELGEDKSKETSREPKAAECIQNALWQPLVYYPWLFGEMGSADGSGGKTDKYGTWGPKILNAQFVGTDDKGNIDADGKTMLSCINQWNGLDDYGADDSKNTDIAWKECKGKDGDKKQGEGTPKRYSDNYIGNIPYLYIWAYELCAEDPGDGDGHSDGKHLGDCWDNNSSMPSKYSRIAYEVSGQDLGSRMMAAAMSAGCGIIINCAVYFICVMLLATKLGVYVLLVFAPIYLMMGIFPGPSRVAAIKLGEMLLANFFKQVGWTLCLVIMTYMYILILDPTSSQNWILKILTCALLTVLFVAYAKPFVRAVSGMAMGDKNAGGAIEGVGADLAKQSAQLAVQAGVAAATGGATLAAGGAGAIAGASGAAKGGAGQASGMDLLKAGLKGADTATGKRFGGRRLRNTIGRVRDAHRDGEESTKGKSEDTKGESPEEDAKSPSSSGPSSWSKESRSTSRGMRYTRRTAELYAQRTGGGDPSDENGQLQLPGGGQPPSGPSGPSRFNPSGSGNGSAPTETIRARVVTESVEMVERTGMTREQMVSNPGTLAQSYPTVAHADPQHPATPPIRSLGAAIADGNASPAQYQAASAAVAQYGPPGVVSSVAAPSTFAPQQDYNDIAFAISSAMRSISSQPSMTERVEVLRTVEASARDVPEHSEMSNVLNDLRSVLSNQYTDRDRINVTLQQVYSAANAANPVPNPNDGGGAGGGGGAT